jgi:hypothetical protein
MRMATKLITFTVKASGSISGYWIAIGDKRLTTTGGNASINLTAGQKYLLVWHMVGNSGSSIAITGNGPGGVEVVNVKQSTIPNGETSAAGMRRFPV